MRGFSYNVENVGLTITEVTIEISHIPLPEDRGKKEGRVSYLFMDLNGCISLQVEDVTFLH